NKLLVTGTACFAVAILSGLLTEQNRKSQDELRVMEGHVKRVEKMAYMGEMAAGLAHEVRNPLASLVGSIQLLKEDLHYDPDHMRLMDIILRETDRLGTLVNDFLFFARPPAGKPEMLDLKEAIDEIVSLFKRDTNHVRRFVLETDLQDGLRVVMDHTHLSQVLWNLLLNAAEAIQEDGRIEISAMASRNNDVRIQVKDNGCGMSQETVSAVFDPFFTTKPEGTGLGLSIVHRILEAYDSRLDVHTQEGAGTTLSFALKRSNRTA
ncbi:MAG: GHKL domain-containing protein, partial [Desulfatitalea sp.]|nr:GHKL domain-containing protein [Desulfatitalea sp.]NNK00183.1 GHKL domain-containing protein [Desulfatitalea sp.]